MEHLVQQLQLHLKARANMCIHGVKNASIHLWHRYVAMNKQYGSILWRPKMCCRLISRPQPWAYRCAKMIFATLVKYGVAFRRRLGFLDNIEPRSLSFSSTNFYLPRWEVPRLGRYVYSKSSSNNMLVHCSQDSNRVSDEREKDIESRRQLPSIK